MNRVIKFRAWNKRRKRMETSDHLLRMDGDNDENLIFLQYTGLHDTNGKEIYEGDIIKYAQYPFGNTIYEIGEISNNNGLLLVGGHSLSGEKKKKTFVFIKYTDRRSKY